MSTIERVINIEGGNPVNASRCFQIVSLAIKSPSHGEECSLVRSGRYGPHSVCLIEVCNEAW